MNIGTPCFVYGNTLMMPKFRELLEVFFQKYESISCENSVMIISICTEFLGLELFLLGAIMEQETIYHYQQSTNLNG